jgi:ribosomal-protein-alanine N-acetyltransferase
MTRAATTPAATTPAVTVRRMRWWDVEGVQALDAELFGPTAWSTAMFWSELAAGESRWYVVAETAAALAGYAGMLVTGSEADVQTIGVAPAMRGHGVGSLLLGAVTAEAVRRGATTMLLEVRADNEPAIALYTREGFERISVRRRYYQPGDIDAWIMRRRPLPFPVPAPVLSPAKPAAEGGGDG